MPKQVIKDIQIKKKISAKQKVEPVIFNNTQTKKLPEKEILTNLEPQKYSENLRTIKTKRPSRNKKVKIIILIILFFIIGIFFILYSITKTRLTITPKIINTDINESITLNSWTNPIKTTVMSFNEEVTTDENNLESAQEQIKQKIKNRFQYDTPPDYILIPGCETNIYYENGPSIENSNNFKMIGKISALLIEKNSIYEYINSSLNLKNSVIKDISGVSCEIKSDITNYEIGQKNNNTSFILSGSIKYEKIIEQEAVKNAIQNKWKKEATLYLNGNEDILSFTLKLRPLNIFPLTSKDIKKINIKIESILD